MCGARRLERPWIRKADNPMNRYVFVFRGGAVVRKELAPAELGAHLQKWMVWLGEMKKQGQAGAMGQRLQVSRKTVRGASKAGTHGPVARAKDPLTRTPPIPAPPPHAPHRNAQGRP